MRLFLASIVAIASLVPAARADAQWRSERPYRGLFAGGVGETEQQLTANASLGMGWDDNLVADAVGRTLAASDITRQVQGSVTTGSASLSYSLNRATVGLGATAGTTVRYYPSLGQDFIRRDYGSFGASALLGGGFSGQVSAMYQPYNLRSLMPSLLEPRLGDPIIVDEDFPASLEHFFGYSAGLSYANQLTRRNTFSAAYNYRGREPVGTADRFDGHNARADLTYTVGRGLGLQLGYGYSLAGYGTGEYGSHVIIAGVNYNRALSFSRRTTLSFGTGSGATRQSRHDAYRFHATGNASLNHEIGRTWHATLSYNRGLQFAENWPEPLLSDSAAAGIGGLFSSRVQLQLTAQALRGRNHFNSSNASGIETYGAAASVTVALTRHVNTGVTSTFYRHEFADDVLLAPGFPNQFERRAIRAFVSLWVPLFQSARRP